MLERMMANHEHLEILKKGVEVWNEWRTDNLIKEVDLYGADLKGANLINADLIWADLIWAHLLNADLTHYTGRIIEKIINEKFGDGSLMFNRHEVFSNIDNQEQTKQKFIAFDEKKVNDIQDQVSKFGDKLNHIFREIRDQKKAKGHIGFKDEIDIPLIPGLILRKGEIEKTFNDKGPEDIKGFSKLSPLIQKTILAFKI